MNTIDEIRERWAKATRGPWKWFGNTKMHEIYLATEHSGRRFVMQFARWGMHSAQPLFQVRTPRGGIMTYVRDLVRYEVRPPPGENPYRYDVDGINHPDADAIAAAPEDVRVLLDEVDRLRDELRRISERTCRGTYGPCGEADVSARDADRALEPTP